MINIKEKVNDMRKVLRIVQEHDIDAELSLAQVCICLHDLLEDAYENMDVLIETLSRQTEELKRLQKLTEAEKLRK